MLYMCSKIPGQQLKVATRTNMWAYNPFNYNFGRKLLCIKVGTRFSMPLCDITTFSTRYFETIFETVHPNPSRYFEEV